MGVNFDEEIQGLWFLNTLSDSWETLCVSLTNFATGGKVTMEYAKSGVLNEEVRRKSQDISSHSDILYTEDRGIHKTRDPRSRGESRSKSKIKNPNIICYHCGKKGHFKRFCKQLKQDLKKREKGRKTMKIMLFLLSKMIFTSLVIKTSSILYFKIQVG